MSAKGVVKILNRSQATVVCSALTVLCGARRCRHSRKVQSPLLALSEHGLLRCTCLLSGIKRTWLFARHMSAFDPKGHAQPRALIFKHVYCYFIIILGRS